MSYPVAITVLEWRAAPNLHGPDPVVCCRLEWRVGARPDGEAEGWQQSLGDLLPGLADAGLCAPHGQPLTWPHLLEHVCVELLTLAGGDPGCVRYRNAATPSDQVVVPFQNQEICRRAIRFVNGWLAFLAGADGGFDPRAALQSFRESAARRVLPMQDQALLRAARARDIPIHHVEGRTFTLGQGRFQQRISATKTSRTSVLANDLAADKHRCRNLLGDLGLPVPRWARVRRRRDAQAAAEQIGFPVAIKPVFGSMGRGVTVGVESVRDLRAAWRSAREHGRSVLVEEVVPGEDHRLLVVGGRLCAAARRMPAHVVGDGQQTIRELVDEANRDPRRGHDHNSPLSRLELDEAALGQLARTGFSADSVAPDGVTVFLRRNANLSTGGVAFDVTDQVHPENRYVAERAAKAVGLDIAGVDVLSPDISRPLWENGGRICEINSRPGIRKHLWPSQGRARDVVTPIVDMLFPDGGTGRIPTIAVLGSGPVRLCAEMIAEGLAAAGRPVAAALEGEVVTCGVRVRHGEPLPLAQRIRRAVLDPDVEAAVMQVTAAGIAASGLGLDAVDFTVVLGDGPVASVEVEGLRLLASLTRRAVVLEGSASADLAVPPGVPVIHLRPPAAGSRGTDEARAAAALAELAAPLGLGDAALQRTLTNHGLDPRLYDLRSHP